MNIDVDRTSRKARFDLHSAIDKSSSFIRRRCSLNGTDLPKSSYDSSKDTTGFPDDSNRIDERSARKLERAAIDVEARSNAEEMERSVWSVERQDRSKPLPKRFKLTKTTSFFGDRLKNDLRRVDDIVRKLGVQRDWYPKFVTRYLSKIDRGELEESLDVLKRDFSKRSGPDVPRIYSIGLRSRLISVDADGNEDFVSAANSKRRPEVARYQETFKLRENSNWPHFSLSYESCCDLVSNRKRLLPVCAASYLLKTDYPRNERRSLSKERSDLSENLSERDVPLQKCSDFFQGEARSLIEAEVQLRSKLPCHRSPRKRSHRHHKDSQENRRRKVHSHCDFRKSHRNYTTFEPKFEENSRGDRPASFRLDSQVRREPWRVRSMKMGTRSVSYDMLRNHVKIRSRLVNKERFVKPRTLFWGSHDLERSQAYDEDPVTFGNERLEEARPQVRRRLRNERLTLENVLLENGRAEGLRGRTSETRILKDIKKRIDEDFDPVVVRASYKETFTAELSVSSRLKTKESTSRTRPVKPEENVIVQLKPSNDLVESVDSGVLTDLSRYDLLRGDSDLKTRITSDDEAPEERRDVRWTVENDDLSIDRIEKAVESFTEKLIAYERRARIDEEERTRNLGRSGRSSKSTHSFDYPMIGYASSSSSTSARSIFDFSRTSRCSSEEEQILDISTPSLVSLSDSEMDKSRSLSETHNC